MLPATPAKRCLPDLRVKYGGQLRLVGAGRRRGNLCILSYDEDLSHRRTEPTPTERAKKPAARKYSGPPARLSNILESVQAQDGLDALLHVVGSDNRVVANFRMQ
ncbi:hypothetical protein SDC9_110280 [bioreactor metagenome]|uniref:Uncharacterized protein n=1 Tax=bioreactor metagenome TaxID=1076179 RepID=A0A645BD59_9ZZZZ